MLLLSFRWSNWSASRRLWCCIGTTTTRSETNCRIHFQCNGSRQSGTDSFHLIDIGQGDQWVDTILLRVNTIDVIECTRSFIWAVGCHRLYQCRISVIEKDLFGMWRVSTPIVDGTAARFCVTKSNFDMDRCRNTLGNVCKMSLVLSNWLIEFLSNMWLRSPYSFRNANKHLCNCKATDRPQHW
jgi:hypothetical protein